MMSSRRLLVLSGAGVAAMLAVTAASGVASSRPVEVLADNTPEGTVQHYLLALRENNLQEAYGCLNVVVNGQKQSYEKWRPTSTREPSRSWMARIARTVVDGDTAVVNVDFDGFEEYSSFGRPYWAGPRVFDLAKTGGVWYITSRHSLWSMVY